jgi:hypothetical protein
MVGLEDEPDVFAPELRQSSGPAPAVDRPAIRTVPLVGVSMQPRMESSVVLPLPDGPIKSVNSPPVTVRLTPLSASARPGPLPRNFTTSTASSIASVIA